MGYFSKNHNFPTLSPTLSSCSTPTVVLAVTSIFPTSQLSSDCGGSCHLFVFAACVFTFSSNIDISKWLVFSFMIPVQAGDLGLPPALAQVI